MSASSGAASGASRLSEEHEFMKAPGSASTDSERVAKVALGSIEAWRHRTIGYERAVMPVMSPVHRAVASDCWRVTLDDDTAFFMKVINRDLIEPVDVAAAYRAAEAAASRSLTPLPRFLIEKSGAAVFDLLDAGWETARLDDLSRPDVLAKLIEAKRTIHTLAPFERDTNVFDRIARLEHEADQHRVPFPSDVVPLIAIAARMGRAISASGLDRVPCHADGTASNVMLHLDGRLQLVDFDEAANTDPLFDLAVTLNEILSFESEWLGALEMAEGRATAASVNRCHLYAFADDLRWGLWGLMMDAGSPRRSIEFLKYAQWRLLRCRVALDRMDIDEKLNHV
jgi:thiamine kinase-like enzyme